MASRAKSRWSVEALARWLGWSRRPAEAGPITQQPGTVHRERDILTFVEDLFECVGVLDEQDRFTSINASGIKAFGRSESEILGSRVVEILPERSRPAARVALARARRGKQTSFTTDFVRPDGTSLTYSVALRLLNPEQPGDRRLLGVATDVTPRTRSERYRKLSDQVLRILNESGEFSDSIARILEAIQLATGCAAVGLRLRSGNDYPYFAQRGFPREFLLNENSLLVHGSDGETCCHPDGNPQLACTCGLVLSGRTDPSNPLFTPGGSFWTNDARVLLDQEPCNDARIDPQHQCVHQGFASFALVPVRVKQEIVGLLQINDFKKGQFGPEAVSALEGMANHIGEALLRRQAEEKLKQSEERHRLMFEGSRDAMMIIITPSVTFSMVNQAAVEMFRARDASQLTTLKPGELSPLRQPDGQLSDEKAQEMVQCALREGSHYFEWRHRRLNGEEFPATVLLSTVKVGGESILGTTRDITERKAMEQKLRNAAENDRLTGLPNRAVLLDRLQMAIARQKRVKDACYAVLFLDFDRFKTVNDGLGHEVGDELLCEIARRLQAEVREVDSISRQTAESTTARLGGDEFVILLDYLQREEDAQLVAQRLLAVLSAPYHIQGHEIVSTASIGVVTSGHGHERAEDVLRDADTAMYEAKSAGKSSAVMFSRQMRERLEKKFDLEQGLRHALEHGELVLHYQPIVDLDTGAVKGFEALVHSRHPQRGVIRPGEFLPVAEETGLVGPICEWAIREAAGQLASWWRTFGRERIPIISVSLSRRQLVQIDLPRRLLSITEEMKLDPAGLHLAVTESAIMIDAQLSNQILRQLKAQGFKIEMDDFGTGHSSLASLHRFPLDVLKIHHSFIENLERGNEFIALVSAIVTLARNLNIAVVAEGVVSEKQMTMLQTLDCDMAQGLYFAGPMPPQEATDYLVHRTGIPKEKAGAET